MEFNRFRYEERADVLMRTGASVKMPKKNVVKTWQHGEE